MEIRDEIRELIINELINNQVVKTYDTKKTVTNKIRTSENGDIAISSKGTPYVKSKVFMYLCQQGLLVSQENIDQAAELFPIEYDEAGESYAEIDSTIIEKTNILNDMTNDEIMAYINTKTLIELNALNQKNSTQFEYTVISVKDTPYGSTDIYTLGKTINTYSNQGWKVIQMFTNELGKESTGVGYGGVAASTNATLDEVVVVFERAKK